MGTKKFSHPKTMSKENALRVARKATGRKIVQGSS